MEKVNIICMKWGTKYDASYVNKLYRMVASNLSRPFRFVCMTDDNAGIREEVECLQLPELELPPGSPERGWNKLVTFNSELDNLKGTALFLDLDVLVVDNIDSLFDIEGEFLIIKDWIRKDCTGNSSVYRFNIGAHPDIIEYFRNNFNSIQKQHRNEQEYLSHYLDQQGKLSYWPESWCKSFKYHCIQKGLKAWFSPPEKPEGAKIIVFHGNPNPPDAIAGHSGKWYRKVLPTAWVADYWRE